MNALIRDWSELVAFKLNLHRNVICVLIGWNIVLTIYVLLK